MDSVGYPLLLGVTIFILPAAGPHARGHPPLTCARGWLAATACFQ